MWKNSFREQEERTHRLFEHKMSWLSLGSKKSGRKVSSTIQKIIRGIFNMEEKKKSAIKQMVEGIVQIVVGIVGLIILAGVGSWFADSDDNQSTNTVATSTNVVETEDTVAETKNTSAKDIISNKTSQLFVCSSSFFLPEEPGANYR